MKYGLLIIALLGIGLLFVAGCTTGQASSPPPSGPIGGGCGVGAPADDAGALAGSVDYALAA